MSLIAHYMMNETSGTAIADTSGNGRTGTAARDASLMTYWPGKAGSPCLDFNGTTDVIDCGADWIGTQALTICAWVYLDSYGENNLGRIVDNTKILFFIAGAGPSFAFSSSGATVAYSANGSASLGTWIHIAVNRTTGGTCNFFVNGVANGSTGQSSGTPAAGSTVYIGDRAAGDRTFNGRIEDLRVYNKIHGADRIREIYNAGIGSHKQYPWVRSAGGLYVRSNRRVA